MRNIEFNEPQSDSWKKWKEKCDQETKELIDNWKPGSEIKIKPNLYKKQKAIYFEKGPFREKCAYCESVIGKFDDLDHFRPKKQVTDEKDNTIKIEINGEKIDHPGYYWLIYSWDNLLPSCKECNSRTRINDEPIGKRNRFPVIGTHASKPGDEKNETPLLLNPVIDDVDDHLRWDNESKLIVANNGSKKGQMTIKVLGFHLREQLRIEWEKAYDNVFRYMSSLLSPDAIDRATKIEKYKKEINDGGEPHSMVAKAALNDIEMLISS